MITRFRDIKFPSTYKYSSDSEYKEFFQYNQFFNRKSLGNEDIEWIKNTTTTFSVN